MNKVNEVSSIQFGFDLFIFAKPLDGLETPVACCGDSIHADCRLSVLHRARRLRYAGEECPTRQAHVQEIQMQEKRRNRTRPTLTPIG